MTDKIARECREFADRVSENALLDSVQVERARALLLRAATRIDVLCSVRGRLLDKTLPKPPRSMRRR